MNSPAASCEELTRGDSIGKRAFMQRTMIYLDDGVHLKLRHLALDERVTMAGLIRHAVDEFLMKQDRGHASDSKKTRR